MPISKECYHKKMGILGYFRQKEGSHPIHKDFIQKKLRIFRNFSPKGGGGPPKGPKALRSWGLEGHPNFRFVLECSKASKSKPQPSEQPKTSRISVWSMPQRTVVSFGGASLKNVSTQICRYNESTKQPEQRLIEEGRGKNIPQPADY